MPLLVDLSNNNPTPNFATVKAFGVAGVYLKASEGVHFTDGFFALRRAAAAKAGLRVGAYHFAQPGASSPSAQANTFCDVIRSVGPRELRPALDLETSGNLTASELVNWARVFNREIKAQLGVLPVFYSYGAFITAMKPATPIGAGLWLAAYGRNDGVEHGYIPPAPWRKAVAHQFTSQAHVPGCAGPVDLSYARSLLPLLAHPATGLLAWRRKT